MKLGSELLRRVASTGVLKQHVGREISRPWVGAVIARATRDRIRKGDVKFDVSSSLISPRTKAQIFWGLYESAEQRFIRRWLRPDLDVIELGSSIGVVSSVISQVIEPGRRMICVEANPNVIPILKRNLDLNAHGRRLDIVNAAIDYESGSKQATLYFGESTVSSTITGTANQSGPSTTVPTTTLGGIADDLGIGEYALVADIEGSEVGMIARDAAALQRCQQLVIELHSVKTDDRIVEPDYMVAQLIGEHGFRLRARHGPVCVFDRDPGGSP